MRIWHSINEAARNGRPVALAIGTFDGVHLGHQAVIASVLAEAGKLGLTSTVMTFTRHPLEAGDTPPLVCPVEVRLEHLAALGVEQTILIPFDRELAVLPPDLFVRETLCQKLGMRMIAVGHDFRFGAGARGDAALLTAMGRDLGFTVARVPPVVIDGRIVSSTAIRWALSTGDVAIANQFLGRPFTIRGSVVPGERRGQTLGFPTANIALAAGSLWPRYGVYAVLIRFTGEQYYGVANVGVKPTFGGGEPRVEVFIFGFRGNLYNSLIEVALLDFIRPERRFATVEDLQAQIGADIERARIVLGLA